MVRVGLISSHSVVRAGVRSMLADYRDRITVVDIGPEADLGEADVVLYDVLGLHQGDGRDLELAVKAQPGRVLALSRELGPIARVMMKKALADARSPQHLHELLAQQLDDPAQRARLLDALRRKPG